MQVGIDIQDIEPVKRFIGTNKMTRIFTASELEYIAKKAHSPLTVAGMFCAKEAFFKALGTGIDIKKLLEVEIRHTPLGAPYYSNDPSAILSISHTKTTAVAVCIIIRVSS